MQLQVIHNKIYDIRDEKIMLDFDLADLYEVETRIFNQAVKRNIENFPKDFKLFDLTINPLRQKLFSITNKNASQHSTIISLPNADGNIEQFEVL